MLKKIILVSLAILISFHFSFSQKTKEELQFNKVLKINTEKAYTDFLKKYPTGNFTDKAMDARLALDSINVVSGTFLGNGKRNYYGNLAPDKLDVIWKLDLGEGNSPVRGKPKMWKGAGWTGQPLFVREKGVDYVILGAFDFNLKKIESQVYF